MVRLQLALEATGVAGSDGRRTGPEARPQGPGASGGGGRPSTSGGSRPTSPIDCCDLSAEMRLPGRAWLQFEVEPSGSGSVIRQTAEFEPLGLAGLAYWYVLYPLHRLIFEGMLSRIARLSGGQQAAAPCREEV